MPKYRYHQSDFSAGEIGPKSHGRTDLESYRKGLKQQENFITMPQGGVTKRYGAKFSRGQRDSLDATVAFGPNTVLIPFQASNGKDYVIILDENLSGRTYTAVDVETGRHLPIAHQSSPDSDKHFIGYSVQSEGPFVGGNISSTEGFDYAQYGDSLVIVHPELPPFFIRRDTFGAFKVYSFFDSNAIGVSSANEWESFPYTDINVSLIKITLTGTVTVGGTVTLTATQDLFNENHEGAIFMVSDGGSNFGYARIDTFTSATVLVGTVLKQMPPISVQYQSWAETAWSNFQGYPRTVGIANGRMMLGASRLQPDTAWFSQLYDIFQLTVQDVDHGLTVTATNPDSFTATLGASTLSEINWIRTTTKNIAMGTSDTEYTVYGPDNTAALGRLNFRFSVETGYGSENVTVPLVGSRVLYVQKGGRVIRDFFYSREVNGYISNDISVLGEHFSRKSMEAFSGDKQGHIKQLVFQKTDDEIVWVLDSNGYLHGMTRSESNGIQALHDHTLGGFSNSAADEKPKVMSMCAVKSGDRTYDILWLIVERYIDGALQYSLEYIGQEFLGTSLDAQSVDVDDHPVFMDSSELRVKANDNFYASYDSGFDADNSDGVGTGTATGSPPTPSGSLDLTGAGVDHVDYAGLDNADFPQTGCIRFLFKQDYNFGGSPGLQTLFSLSAADSSNKNLIQLRKQAFGIGFETFYLDIYDSSSVAILNAVVFKPQIGLEDLDGLSRVGVNDDRFSEIEVNYDLTTGETRIFVDGVQFGVTVTSTGTRDTDVGLLRVGSDIAAADSSDFFIKDFQVYDSVQHTENYKPTTHWDGTTTVKGLDRLEGQSVRALRDGIVEAAQTVTSGEITLDEAGDYVVIGLPYTGKLRTMEIEDGAASGSAQGAIKRIDKMMPRFYKTTQAAIGSDVGNVDEIEFRNSDESISDPIAPKTGIRDGDYGLDADLDSSRQASVYIESGDPVPCTVVGLTVRGVTGD